MKFTDPRVSKMTYNPETNRFREIRFPENGKGKGKKKYAYYIVAGEPCKQCGAPFLATYARRDDQAFCSNECVIEYAYSEKGHLHGQDNRQTLADIRAKLSTIQDASNDTPDQLWKSVCDRMSEGVGIDVHRACEYFKRERRPISTIMALGLLEKLESVVNEMYDSIEIPMPLTGNPGLISIPVELPPLAPQ